MMRKVYLAGKINKNDWRHGIVNGLGDYPTGPGVCGDDGASIPDYWPVLIDSINPDGKDFSTALAKELFLGKFSYVGPYPIGCDHGCFHGQNTHGSLTNWNYEDGHYHQFVTENLKHRDQIVSLCLDAIKRADIIFAWVDSLSAYGTIAEIGYAKALGKEVFIAGPESYDDLWFIYRMIGGSWGQYPDPKRALRSALEYHVFSDRYINYLFSLCESPIEKTFFEAAHLAILNLRPQYQIGLYRVDFAMPESKVVIELDGHDYHKTKEQRTHDAERERFLEMQGWRVIRFTGSEVYKDSERCIDETLALINKWASKAPQE